MNKQNQVKEQMNTRPGLGSVRTAPPNPSQKLHWHARSQENTALWVCLLFIIKAVFKY